MNDICTYNLSEMTLYFSRCKTCKGKKTTKDKKIIEIEIDKGAPSDFRKVFYGEVTFSQ